ncbi:putative amino acid tansporter [Trypanosoma rangeli]|uniref:Putative amino acid tansporter n=1 Tax=Trypanosoma rangeli TaxID=5698 RepID=A0A422MZQ8_TRYRA|nr:putative amino acid tansporter [Trypanosoma rangeli]RNE98661.1 putative amino acid tansporter [Trypanosoma rangeli]|eukprot:RNE98661.1 putative amino acid tansporter [Trypanosoma rangeli]
MTSRKGKNSLHVGRIDAAPQATATASADSQSSTTVEGPLEREKKADRIGVHKPRLPLASSVGPSAATWWHSVSSQSENRRTPPLLECSRILTPVQATHRLGVASGAVSNFYPRMAILRCDRYTATPNYHTSLDEISNVAEEKNVDYGNEINEDIDIHFLGEHLTDVLECSLLGESITQLAEHHNTLGRAAFHIFKGNVGAGVFLLPTYYQDAGYGVGFVFMVLLGSLMIDCALALVKSKQKIDLAVVRTYPAVVGYILGDALKHFTDFSLLFTQFGFCVVYIQYASSIFASIFAFSHAYHVFVFLAVFMVTPMTFFSHHMGALAYASMLAAVFVVIVLAGAVREEVVFLATRGVSPAAVFFVPTMRIFVFISGHMFSLEGIGTVLPVENSMTDEDLPQFATLVKYTLASIVATYLVVGVLGYLAFGDALQTSVVLAIPPSKTKIMLQVLLGFSLIFSYPIQFVPAIQLVDRALGISVRKERKKVYLVRVVLNIFFGALAGSIGADTVNVLASFLGAFTGVHLMITLPVLLALFTDPVLGIALERTELTFRDYVKIFFTMPDTLLEYRWYLYLLLALCVWIGGMYYTFDSIFG